jgi:RHS repeat-associated protein
VSYDYDALGQKTSVRITNGTTMNYAVTYNYFANGWLKRVKSGSSTIAEYSYDAVGNRTVQTNGNGTSTEYAFDSDPRYRVTSITHKRGSNVLAQIGYPSRDSAGNPLGMTDWTGTWGYGYDSNNRLIGATPPNPVPGQPAGGPYGYDWVGNRIHPPGDPNPMVYNDGDQLVRWPGMYRYSYDGAGNLVQVKNDSQTQVLKSYTYTPAGLLATATFRDKDGNTRTLSNTWDADSNRVSFDANGTEYELVYDTTAGIPAVLEESTSGSTAYYIREPGGSLIARVHPTEGIRYYHFDELGSTRLLTDGSGNVTDKYAYDAYGSLLAHDRSAGSVSQPYQYVGQLGYYAHYMEPDFGLLQLGVRFYDAEVGRFTQRDPVGDAMNAYVYSDDCPVTHVDPSGRISVPPPSVILRWLRVGGVAGFIVGCLVAYSYDCVMDAREVAERIHAIHDKWAHCYMACKAVRCLYRLPGLAGALTKWFMGRGESDPDDLKANEIGVTLGYDLGGDCYQRCREATKDMPNQNRRRRI